jgi:hypothetical protein
MKTYLNVRFIKIKELNDSIHEYIFGMENVNGIVHYSEILSKYYEEYENKSINILLSTNTLESQLKLIEPMINGMTPIYLIINQNQSLIAAGLVDLAPLF